MVASCSSLFSLADACCIFPITFIRLMLHRCIFMESAMHMNPAGPLSCLVVPCISVVLLTSNYVSMCSQPSRVVLVARLLLKRVTALITVAGCVRGPPVAVTKFFAGCCPQCSMLGLLISNGSKFCRVSASRLPPGRTRPSRLGELFF